MRTWLTLATPLAALALGAAARPAAAQRAVAENARPAALPTATAALLRPVADYRFAVTARSEGLPDRVRLADSVGVLVASFQLPGTLTPRPMLVDVVDTDLVLQGETPTGILTLRLYRQNEVAPAAPFQGRWWLGGRAGELRGRMAR